MRIKVTKKQFKLLFKNLHILTKNGLQMQMNGKTFLYLFDDYNTYKSK